MKRKSKAVIAAEQQAQAEQEARIRAALHWSDDTDLNPDVLPPDLFSNGLSVGYMFNAYNRRVEVACSSSIHHAIGRTDKTTTQGKIPLYSTRERALRALRAALERMYAIELAKIDAELEQ